MLCVIVINYNYEVFLRIFYNYLNNLLPKGCTNVCNNFPIFSEDVLIADGTILPVFPLTFKKGKHGSKCEGIDIFTLHSEDKIGVLTCAEK